ncbi:hypothetical protein GIB67_005216 [Kingdonia uniflora]|uniref:GAGA-binding transcriptional activator n=1 Tax=Kingdonia uniflora TaxID=39325 RepID=A0A7J7NNP4_9MAGN|nr:hypothetical protein GIB67_005216 [Kingdonia uniflora]
MDDDSGLGIRNWGYYEPSVKGHLGLQLMSSVVERDTKPFLSGRDPPVMINGNGGYQHRDCGVPDATIPMEYGWMHQRDNKYMHMIPGNPSFSFLSENSGTTHPSHGSQPIDERDGQIEEMESKKDGPSKKRPRAPKAPKVKKPKKPRAPRGENSNPVQRAKPPLVKKNVGVVINGMDMDISGIPIPVCSCTGVPQQCYRWGCGGWQSACCTTSMSMYPLPMSTKRRGARIAGRKMSLGAFKKVLEKLMGEGNNLSNPIDLRTHWAKHGTNKFVTIK